jgi:ADP-ribosylglycohydrolase
MITARERAIGAFRGLAIGDGLGAAAEQHRSVRTPWVRGALRANAATLDAERVSHPMLPFAPNLDERSGIVPTDDAETAAVAASVLLESDGSPEALFASWLQHHGHEDAWLSVAARGAVRLAGLGYTPPITGSDNPAAVADNAVPAAIPFGIRYAGRPADAARAVRPYAEITNANEGVEAVAVMAAAIAVLVGGGDIDTAVAAARSEARPDGWLRDNLDRALAIVAPVAQAASSPFGSITPLMHLLSARSYSHGGIAPDTVPLALAVMMLAQGDPRIGIPIALTFPRSSDSVPAFVGALCGAASGAGALEGDWGAVDTLAGIMLPTTRGVRPSELASMLCDLAHPMTMNDPVDPDTTKEPL